MQAHLASVNVGEGPTIGLVHGFTQTGRCWGPLAHALALEHRVVAVDAPGHGRSAPFGRAGLWHGADLLVEAVGSGTYVGYSMGARLVLHAALAHPGSVERLVLISGTAGIEEEAARSARRSEDEARASHLEKAGLESFLDDWVRQSLFDDLDPAAWDLPERLRNTVAGLAASLRNAGTGSMEPLWGRLDTLRMPALFIAGDLDQPYVDAAERMAATWGGDATLAIIEGARHAPHRSRPVEVAGAIGDWLRHHTTG